MSTTHLRPEPPEPGDGFALADRLGIQSATAGTRFVAFLIDLLVWLLLATPAILGGVFAATSGLSVAPIVLLAVGSALTTIFGVVQLILHGRRGVTVGKASMRLRSVSIGDLGRPGFWRIVLRALIVWVSGVVPLLGPVLMLGSGIVEPRGRNLPDRAARVWLVDVRAGLDPRDEKAMRRAKRAAFTPKRDIAEPLVPLASGAALRSAPLETRSSSAIVGVSRGAWDQAPAAGVPTGGPEEERIALVFDDGSAVLVTGPGLIGRAPEPIAELPGLALIGVDDPAKQLSKSHLAFGVDAQGFWIEDLDSSNGTFLVREDGGHSEIARGARVPIPLGQAVRIGGRVFEVRRVAAGQGGETA